MLAQSAREVEAGQTEMDVFAVAVPARAVVPVDANFRPSGSRALLAAVDLRTPAWRPGDRTTAIDCVHEAPSVMVGARSLRLKPGLVEVGVLDELAVR